MPQGCSTACKRTARCDGPVQLLQDEPSLFTAENRDSAWPHPVVGASESVWPAAQPLQHLGPGAESAACILGGSLWRMGHGKRDDAHEGDRYRGSADQLAVPQGRTQALCARPWDAAWATAFGAFLSCFWDGCRDTWPHSRRAEYVYLWV